MSATSVWSITSSLSSTLIHLLPWLLAAAFLLSRMIIWYRLRAFQGPWLGSFSSLWMAKTALSGRMNHELTAVIQRYGAAHERSLLPSNFSTEWFEVDALQVLSRALGPMTS